MILLVYLIGLVLWPYLLVVMTKYAKEVGFKKSI